MTERLASLVAGGNTPLSRWRTSPSDQAAHTHTYPRLIRAHASYSLWGDVDPPEGECHGFPVYPDINALWVLQWDKLVLVLSGLQLGTAAASQEQVEAYGQLGLGPAPVLWGPFPLQAPRGIEQLRGTGFQWRHTLPFAVTLPAVGYRVYYLGLDDAIMSAGVCTTADGAEAWLAAVQRAMRAYQLEQAIPRHRAFCRAATANAACADSTEHLRSSAYLSDQYRYRHRPEPAPPRCGCPLAVQLPMRMVRDAAGFEVAWACARPAADGCGSKQAMSVAHRTQSDCFCRTPATRVEKLDVRDVLACADGTCDYVRRKDLPTDAEGMVGLVCRCGCLPVRERRREKTVYWRCAQRACGFWTLDPRTGHKGGYGRKMSVSPAVCYRSSKLAAISVAP